MTKTGATADSAVGQVLDRPLDRRTGERRCGAERRGGLRWDPRQDDRRSGKDRRAARTMTESPPG